MLGLLIPGSSDVSLNSFLSGHIAFLASSLFTFSNRIDPLFVRRRTSPNVDVTTGQHCLVGLSLSLNSDNSFEWPLVVLLVVRLFVGHAPNCTDAQNIPSGAISAKSNRIIFGVELRKLREDIPKSL